jgi:hypothetical protein
MEKKKSFKLILLALGCMTITSCAGLLQNRTFIDEMDRESDGLFVAGRDFDAVPGDSGSAYRSNDEIRMRTPASESEAYDMAQSKALYQELTRKERTLKPRERELYNQAMPYLNTPSEKIYFLSLTPYEQTDYLAARQVPIEGIYQSARGASRSLASLQPIYDRTLNLGMSKDQVVGLWGRPARVEVAGNPQNENERWAFYENGQIKFVYFEAGQVQGWNIQ